MQIGISQQLVDEQRRVVREIGWEYAPDLDIDAGLQDGRRKAGVSVGREGDTWGVNMETGFAISEEDRPEDTDEATWSARIQARIPIFAIFSPVLKPGQSRSTRKAVTRPSILA